MDSLNTHMSSNITPLKRSALEAGFNSPRKDEEPTDEGKGSAPVPKISKARACMQKGQKLED